MPIYGDADRLPTGNVLTAHWRSRRRKIGRPVTRTWHPSAQPTSAAPTQPLEEDDQPVMSVDDPAMKDDDKIFKGGDDLSPAGGGDDDPSAPVGGGDDDSSMPVGGARRLSGKGFADPLSLDGTGRGAAPDGELAAGSADGVPNASGGSDGEVSLDLQVMLLVGVV